MFIMHSTLAQRWHEVEGDPSYFQRLFAYFEHGGGAHVAAWLRARDLSKFNPKAQVERTAGWEAISNTWSEPEDAIGQAIDLLGTPDVLFGTEMVHVQFDGAEEIAGMIKSPRKLGHRMQRSGYVAVKPPAGEDRWVVKGADGNVKFRSRLAFVKQSAINSGRRDGVEVVERHMKRLAA